MAQQLHAWFRYATIFGIYLRYEPMPPPQPRSSPSASSSQQTALSFYGFRRVPRAKAKRQRVWQSTSYRLKRFYVQTLLFWCVLIHIRGVLWRSRVEGAVLSYFVSTILFTSQAFTNLLIIVETLWQQDEHEAFLAQLQNIECSLKLCLRLRCDGVACNDIFAQTVRRYLCYLLAFSLTGLVLFFVSTFWLRYIGYFRYGLWFMLTMRLRIIQLVVYLRILHYYMLCLSAHLRRIVACHTAAQLQPLDLNYARLKSYAHLMAVKEIYAQLFDAFDLFNKFAGWSLLSIITCYMLDISCNIYWCFLSFDGFIARRHYYIASAFWLCPLLAIVWQMCVLGDECSQLDRHIALLLCKIIISSSSKRLAAYRLALQQFSMQLQVQHIQISAKRVFNLNIQLVMSIFTSIVAYIVILIQFLKSYA